jgi:hypothetical protein
MFGKYVPGDRPKAEIHLKYKTMYSIKVNKGKRIVEKIKEHADSITVLHITHVHIHLVVFSLHLLSLSSK